MANLLSATHPILGVAVALDVTIDHIRSVYPSMSDAELQVRLDEAVAWVKYYAPCVDSAEFSAESGAIVRSLIRRALAYDRDTANGAVQSRATGPFSVTVDNRMPSTGTLFNENQQEILKSMCRTSAQAGYVGGLVSVPLGAPRPRFRS